MKKIIKILRVLIILFFLFYSLFFFIGSTFAPIMAYFKQYDLSAVLTSTFMFSCHQQPDRSFWLLGYPVALCCRCYGFYLGVIVSAIIALHNKLNFSLKIFIILLFICITDIVINLYFKFNTGNVTRFVTGIFMGVLFISGLNYLSNLIKTERKYEYEN